MEDLVWRQAVDPLALKSDVAVIGLEEAGDEVEEGGFASAVRPDQAGDAALCDGEVGAVDGLQAAESLANVLNGQDVRTLVTFHGILSDQVYAVGRVR